MCRLLAYLGPKILIRSLLVQPAHSLIKQSMHANESQFVVNGDGFGMSWYVDFDPHPALFKTLRPAWNDPNLLDMASKTKTHCMSAHIRAATTGTVSFSNSHPFRYRQYSMMHNGSIDGFSDIKRPLCDRLSNEAYAWINGQTDSEHFFALLVDRLMGYDLNSISTVDIIESIKETIATVKDLLSKHSSTQSIAINTVITAGDVLIATRYASADVNAPSLYYILGNQYECVDSEQRITQTASSNELVIVASEIPSKNKDHWVMLPENHLLSVGLGQPADIYPL